MELFGDHQQLSKFNNKEARIYSAVYTFLYQPPRFSDEAPLRFVSARVASVEWVSEKTEIGE